MPSVVPRSLRVLSPAGSVGYDPRTVWEMGREFPERTVQVSSSVQPEPVVPGLRDVDAGLSRTRELHGEALEGPGQYVAGEADQDGPCCD